MEDELIIQQNEYEKRSPNQNMLLWFDRYSNAYDELSETSTPLKSFSSLVIIKNEVKQRLENAKSSIEEFSKQLKSILIESDEIESGSELDHLHHNISMCCLLTFTSATFGNFMYGGLNMRKSRKEIESIRKESPEFLVHIKPLQEMVSEYTQKTNQKGTASLIMRIPKAFTLRFLADKLFYQKKALDILIERLLLFDYPSKVPSLTPIERDRFNKFLANTQRKSRSTPLELYEDIYSLIKRLETKKEDEFLFKKGKLVYSVAAETALDDHEDNDEQSFAKKWKKTPKNPKGVTKSWLEKKIKEVYEGVISS